MIAIQQLAQRLLHPGTGAVFRTGRTFDDFRVAEGGNLSLWRQRADEEGELHLLELRRIGIGIVGAGFESVDFRAPQSGGGT